MNCPKTNPTSLLGMEANDNDVSPKSTCRETRRLWAQLAFVSIDTKTAARQCTPCRTTQRQRQLANATVSNGEGKPTPPCRTRRGRSRLSVYRTTQRCRQANASCRASESECKPTHCVERRGGKPTPRVERRGGKPAPPCRTMRRWFIQCRRVERHERGVPQLPVIRAEPGGSALVIF